MDLQYFLNILWRRKWLILIVMLASGLATYLFMNQLPPQYKANAILTTGIIEFKGAKLSQDNPFYQQFQVDNAFDNLREGILSRTTLQRLTKILLQHDLSPDPNLAPFRQLTDASVQMTPEALREFTKALDGPIATNPSKTNTPSHPENQQVINSVAKALEYDYESLKKNLSVQRIGKTDYLNIEFISENPELSFFTVNRFCEEIVQLDKSVQSDEESSTVEFYSKLVNEKKHLLDSLNRILNLYNANQNLVNLEEQSKSIVSQIRELEVIREQYNKDIPALKANIANLNHYIQQTARINADNYANSIFLNEDMQEIKNEIQDVNERYIAGGKKDGTLKARLDKLQQEQQSLINKLASRQPDDVDDNLQRNRDLLDKRLEKELDLNTAMQGVQSLDEEIGRLRSRQKSLVSNDAYVKNLEQQIDLTRKEYFDLVNKLQNAEQVSRKPESRLSILEPAMFPDKPEPTKKNLISAFAAISSGVMATVFLFLFTFFDLSIKTPLKLENATGLPVIGNLNKIAFKKFDLNQVFNGDIQKPELQYFTEELRKIRYEVETSGAQTFLITSPKESDGKSFFLLSLSYALSLSNKKVLLVDSNFRHNSLSALATLPPEVSPFLSRKKTSSSKTATAGPNRLPAMKGFLPQTVSVMPNRGGNMSPAEALAGIDFVRWLHEQKDSFDYIFLEGSALNIFADSKELALYADKVIGIFSAESVIQNRDHETIQFLKSLQSKYAGSILNRSEWPPV